MELAMAGGAGPDVADPYTMELLMSLYERYYRDLARLSALLTGDRTVGDAIASDCLLALCHTGDRRTKSDQALLYLRRHVVVRSRRASLRPALSNGSAPDPGRGPEAAAFTDLPVVGALRLLRPAEREAVVLVLYLDLPEQEAAAVLGLGQTRLARNLATGVAALQARLPGPYIADPVGQS
jgi:DNA-directed RNA polymerase specialized sigma24 family protein